MKLWYQILAASGDSSNSPREKPQMGIKKASEYIELFFGMGSHRELVPLHGVSPSIKKCAGVASCCFFSDRGGSRVRLIPIKVRRERNLSKRREGKKRDRRWQSPMSARYRKLVTCLFYCGFHSQNRDAFGSCTGIGLPQSHDKQRRKDGLHAL
jgi:hypothetical protein